MNIWLNGWWVYPLIACVAGVLAAPVICHIVERRERSAIRLEQEIADLYPREDIEFLASISGHLEGYL